MFSYLNWLAHIDLRNSKYVDESKMIEWLQRVTLWPREVAEAFWWCLRNPTMHLGRTFFFSDYDRKSTSKLKLFADLHPNLQFDPLAFQPDEFKPTPPEDGHFAVIDPLDERKLDVHFFFPGVRRKLDDALGSTLRGIEEADKNSLTSLAKLNRKLLPFRVWAGDEGDPFEADAPEPP